MNKIILLLMVLCIASPLVRAENAPHFPRTTYGEEEKALNKELRERMAQVRETKFKLRQLRRERMRALGQYRREIRLLRQKEKAAPLH